MAATSVSVTERKPVLTSLESKRGLSRRTDDWQRYHRSAHSSPAQVARIANTGRPKTLVLYHQLYFGVGDEELVEEVRAAGYAGPLVSGQDFDVFQVNPPIVYYR